MALLGEIMVMFTAETAGFTSGAGVVVAGLVGIGAALGESVKMAGDFQQSVVRLKTGAGDTQDSFASLSSGILKVSVATGVMSGPLSQAMYLIASSGQRGAQAMNTLKVSAEGAQIEMANVSDVANVVSGVMTNYANKNYSATQVMNGLIYAVAHGKITLQDLAVAMGPIDPIAQAMGIHFNEVAAAMTTQTNAMIPAARAATGLRFLLQSMENPTKKATTAMKEMGLNTVDVANEMKVSLPGALQMVYNAAKKAGPEGSVPFTRAVSDMIGGQRALTAFTALTGIHMKDFVKNAQGVAAAMKAAAGDVNGWAQVQGNFNIKMDQAKAAVEALAINIGTALLPVLTGILSAVTPIIAAMANWASANLTASGMLALLHDHAQIIIPVLAGIGAVLAAILVPAMIALAGAIISATWPFVAIGLAVAGLVAIFLHFYNTCAPFRALIDSIVAGFRSLWSVIVANVQPAFAAIGAFLSGVVLPILERVGAFLLSTFKPVWDQLVATMQGQVIPMWHTLVSAIQPMLPTFKLLAEIIGVIVVAAVLTLVAILGGLIHAFSSLLSGVISIMGGLVEVISGAFKVIAGLVTFIVDLFTLKWGNLGHDLGTIMDGIGTMFHGTWAAISGFLQATIGAIIGFFAGFVQAAIALFQGLADALVGHSIIPDMCNAIVQWFAALPGRAVSAVIGIISMVGNIFSQLASQAQAKAQELVAWVYNALSQLAGRASSAIAAMSSVILGGLASIAGAALSAGANIVQQIASGIMGAIGGALGGAMSAVGSFISSHLPASPAKMGPLRNLAKQGGEIANQISIGLMGNMPNVQASLEHLIVPSGKGLVTSGGTGQNNGPVTINLIVDGRTLAKALGPHMASEIRLVTGVSR